MGFIFSTIWYSVLFQQPINGAALHESCRTALGFDGVEARSQAAHVKLAFVTFPHHHATCHVENANESSLHDIQVKYAAGGIRPSR